MSRKGTIDLETDGDTDSGGGGGAGISAFPREELASVPTTLVEAELVDLSKRLSAGSYEVLVLVGDYEARGVWALHGSFSCAAWLADPCEIKSSTAHKQVRVARSMRDFPELDAAMRNGDMSYAKARELVANLDVDNVAEFLDLASYTPAGRLGVAIAAWSRRNEDEGLLAARQRVLRSCSWRTEPDGMVTITARQAPENAGIACAVLDTQVMRRDRERGLASNQESNQANSSSSLPSLSQQRADALVKLVTGTGGVVGDGVASDGVPSSDRRIVTEVVIHVREDGNALADGMPLSDNAVTAMLDDSFISLLVHDMKRQPIDASSRRRFPTRRQQRVIDERFDECRQPGCHARAFLQYDHIQPYALGGPTTIDNPRRWCGPHNRAREP